MLSDLASKFYRQVFTSSTRGYADKDNTAIIDDTIVLQILIVGPQLLSTDICYQLFIPLQCNNYWPNQAFLSVDSYLFKIATSGQQYLNQHV